MIDSPLMRAARFFTRQTRTMSCLSIACGTADDVHRAADGEIGGGRGPVTERTIFDLASLTKLFTGLTVMRLWEQGRIDLQRPARLYVPDFTGLGETTVEQLLTFGVSLQTPARLDALQDAASARSALQAEQALPNTGTRMYSDMHAITLGYAVQGATGSTMAEMIRECVLNPAGITDHVFIRVPKDRLADCVDYSGEHRIEKDRWIVRSEPEPGVPHDPKARLLMADGSDVCGHAGLFSDMEGMIGLCRSLLKGLVVSEQTLRLMAQNRTGRQLPDGSWTQFLGCQCYVKHPVQYFSEIPVYMSGEAIGLSGFTGNHVAIDPRTGRFSLYLGNRVHDRLSILIPPDGRSRTDYGLSPDGTGTIRWTDGTQVPSSVDYVHLKDEHLHGRIMEEMGWQPYQE